ncbi:ABC transporter ATP-binding protein [Robinsoniella peoriensis]|uniref:ABC transporter ATP-binding protein n=1 Tax=Robinsoniella peoriensis TaxID=180332 RepID=UPI0037504B3B
MAKNRFDQDESLEKEFDFSHMKRSIVYVNRHRKKMIISLLLSAASVICSLIPAKIIGYAVDNTIPKKDMQQLITLTAAMVVLIGISVALAVVRAKIMAYVGQDIIFDIRNDLFEKLQKLPFKYYDERPHGKILVRVINYVNNVSDMLSNGIINFILETFNIIFILFFMLTTSVKLTLIVLAGIPVLVAGLLYLKPKQRKAWQSVNNKGSNMNAYFQESINGVTITQNFVRQQENEAIFKELNTENYNACMRALRLAYLISPIVDMVAVAAVGAMYLAGVAWLKPVVSFGVILVMGDYAWRMWQPIINIANLYNNLLNTMSYLERIFEIMDEPVDIEDKPEAVKLPPITGQVDFEDVTFAYEGAQNILEHMDLHIKPGEHIALVGPTGAGKSTVVNLLSRFYDVNAGRILVDGHDISEVTLYSLREQMGVMQQDSFIFSGTVSDNVRYGRLEASDEEIEKACETVCAAEFIREMEHGFQTNVGENGGTLSQGQKQLLAFARTLLRNPKILILDEATSSVDTKTERLLQEGLQKLMEGRTSFVVAHRLSTIKNCTRILYISDKGIAESGSHDELMCRKGLYYNLVMSQSK